MKRKSDPGMVAALRELRICLPACSLQLLLVLAVGVVIASSFVAGSYSDYEEFGSVRVTSDPSGLDVTAPPGACVLNSGSGKTPSTFSCGINGQNTYTISVSGQGIPQSSKPATIYTDQETTVHFDVRSLITALQSSPVSASAGVSAPAPAGAGAAVCLPPPGMTLWFTGDGTAIDKIGNKQGTLVGSAAYSAGKVGQAFGLGQGGNCYVSVPDSPQWRIANNDFTIEGWVKPTNVAGEFTIVYQGDGGAPEWKLAHSPSYGLYLCMRYHPEDAWFNRCTTLREGRVGMQAGQYYHVAVTRSGNVFTIYRDGQVVASATESQRNWPDAPRQVRIGARDDGNCLGDVDELSVYNRALSQQEIQAIVSVGSAGKSGGSQQYMPPPSGLVAFYKGENNGNDETGQHHGLVDSRVQYAAGKVGQAFKFDGSSSITIASASDIDMNANTGISFGAWVNPESLHDGFVLSKFDGRGQGYWIRFLQGGVVDAAGGNSDCSNNGNAVRANIPVNGWSFVMATVSPGRPGTLTLYVNGKPAGTVQAYHCATSRPLMIGLNPNYNQRSEFWFFRGLIDEAQVYNRELSAAEVDAEYRAGVEGRCKQASVPLPPEQPVKIVLGDSIAGGIPAKARFNITVWSTPNPSVVYCSREGRWLETLDFEHPASCKATGLTWTGAKCCGEFKNQKEFYNDPAPPKEPVCLPGKKICVGNAIKTCGYDFNYSISQECPGGCIDPKIIATAAPSVVGGWVETEPYCIPCPPCTGEEVCYKGACVPKLCDPITGSCGIQSGSMSQISGAAFVDAPVKPMGQSRGGSDSLITGLAVAQGNCPPQAVNLAAWYPGENAQAQDFISGSQGTVVGASFVGGARGQAFNFDGRSGYVRVANSQGVNPGTGSFSVSAFIFPRSFGGIQRIVWKNDGGEMFKGYYLMLSGDQVMFGVGDSTAKAEPGFLLPRPNAWYHVVGVYDRSTQKARLYVDTVLQSEKTASLGSVDSNSDFFISSQSGNTEFFNGVVDEVTFWKSPLSGPQVKSLNYPFHWFPADDTPRDVINHNMGQLQGGATFGQGMVGKAFALNGNSAFVSVPDSDQWSFGDSAFTISLWANFNSRKSWAIQGLPNVFIGQDEGPYVVNKWVFSLGNEGLNFLVAGPSIGDRWIGVIPFDPVMGQWYHLAVVRQGATYSFFVDGNKVGSGSDASPIPNPAAPLTIGQAEQLGYFNGRLDEIKIFKRALSDTEIKDMVNADAGVCPVEQPPPSPPPSIQAQPIPPSPPPVQPMPRPPEPIVSGGAIVYPYSTDTPGGCWNSTYIANGVSPQGTNNKVLEIVGRLFGCGLAENDPLLSLKDDHWGLKLITPAKPCTLAQNIRGIAGFNLFCSAKTGTWTSTPIDTKRKLVASPKNPDDKECCPEGSCWDGTTCVEDQSNQPALTASGVRCIKGSWITGGIKLTPNRAESGFCPSESQCLVNPAGNPANNNKPRLAYALDRFVQPACIDNGQYYRDFFCLNGEWTSRARALSLELVDMGESLSPNNYAVFCGTYEEVLNFMDYEATANAGSVRQYMERSCTKDGLLFPCVNNFCAIRYGDNKLAFATSLNIEVNDQKQSFLSALKLNPAQCNDMLVGDGKFNECTPTVSYNHALEALIVQPQKAVAPAVTGAAGYTFKTARNVEIAKPMEAMKAYYSPPPVIPVQPLPSALIPTQFTPPAATQQPSCPLFSPLPAGWQETCKANGGTIIPSQRDQNGCEVPSSCQMPLYYPPTITTAPIPAISVQQIPPVSTVVPQYPFPSQTVLTQQIVPAVQPPPPSQPPPETAQAVPPPVKLPEIPQSPTGGVFKQYIDNISIFRELYILKTDTKAYFGVLEMDVKLDVFVDIVLLAYDNFGVYDPETRKTACDMIADRLDTSKLMKFNCVYDPDLSSKPPRPRMRLVAVARSPESGAQELPLRTFWKDMTAKLR